MYKITQKEMLTPTICRMVVEAPRLAAAAKPGQFLIVRADEKGERIPLTISDFDVKKGTVTIVTQPIGASTQDIVAFEQSHMVQKPYRYIILGDEKDLDMKALQQYGPVKRLTTQEIFGY